jgi:hypothetical protein
VVNRSIDDNDCSGPRLVAEASGYFSLDDRLLGIMLDGVGSDRPFEMAPTSATVGEHQQHFTIAFAERPADQDRPAATLLDARAFTSRDGATYHSERYVLLIAATSGDPLFGQEVLITLQIDPPLPLPEAATARVELTFWLSQFDAAVGPDTSVDEITIAFDATVRADLDRKQIIASELLAVAPEQRSEAWAAMLAARGLGGHSESFGWTLRQHVFPSLRFTDANPHVLSATLPQYGRWTKSSEPPPVLP